MNFCMNCGASLQVIRSLLGPDKYVIVVEHDLSVLDYLSDFICCLYGKPGAYGEQPSSNPPLKSVASHSGAGVD